MKLRCRADDVVAPATKAKNNPSLPRTGVVRGHDPSENHAPYWFAQGHRSGVVVTGVHKAADGRVHHDVDHAHQYFAGATLRQGAHARFKVRDLGHAARAPRQQPLAVSGG